MTKNTPKPKLQVEQRYTVELYPGKVRLNAKYLGEVDGNHIFVNESNQRKEYVFVNNHWMIEQEGVITHNKLSSFSIRVVNENIGRLLENLLRKLNKSESK